MKAETAIRSIIRQLIDATTLSEHIESQLRNLDQKPFVELEDWVDLARQTINCSSAVYIFIDGLDESDAAERRALLDALSSLVSTASDLRLFISSRDSLNLDLEGRFSSIEHVILSPSSLLSDIHLYITATIDERIRDGDLMMEDLRLLNDIKQTLTRHADGM